MRGPQLFLLSIGIVVASLYVVSLRVPPKPRSLDVTAKPQSKPVNIAVYGSSQPVASPIGMEIHSYTSAPGPALYSDTLHRSLTDHEVSERDTHFSMWRNKHELYVQHDRLQQSLPHLHELLEDVGDIVLFQCPQDMDTPFIQERLHLGQTKPAAALQHYVPDLSVYSLSSRAHSVVLQHTHEWILPVHEYLTTVARRHSLSVQCVHKEYLDRPAMGAHIHSGWLLQELKGFRCMPFITEEGAAVEVTAMNLATGWNLHTSRVYVALESAQNGQWDRATTEEADMIYSHAQPAQSLLHKWTPLSYITGELGLYMQDTFSFSERTAPLMYWIANCVQPRMDLIASITRHIPTTAMGRCVAPGSATTASTTPCQRQGGEGVLIGMNDEKLCTYRHSRLALAIENSHEDMYITEKLWLPLLAGSVPVYSGMSQVSPWLPSPEAAIDLQTFPSIEEAALYIQQVQSNETLWNYHTAWRKRPFSIPFLHLARNSLQSLYCNLPSLRPPVTKEACFSWATFADSKYVKTLQRITAEAKAFGIFDELYPYNETMLGEAFMNRNREFMQNNPTGYGYWIWKPFVIQEALQRMKPGCFLVFTDAGCTIQPGGVRRAMEYARLLNANHKHVLGFQMPHMEGTWTKGDLFHFMNATTAGLEATGQIVGGITMIRNSPEGRAYVSRWRQITQEHPQLITDAPSVQPNFPGFIAHRHDQSVVSMLLKTEFAHIAHLMADETWHKDFSQILSVPFTATRMKYR